MINAFLQLSGLVLVGVGSTYFGDVCGGGSASGFRCDRLGAHQHPWLQIGPRVNLSRDRNTHSTHVWLHFLFTGRFQSLMPYSDRVN